MESPQLEMDAGGRAWVIFDDPDARVNLLNTATVKQLDVILDSLRRQPPRALIFFSAKPGIFIAGADITELEAITTAARGTELSRIGHSLFDQIEQLEVPTVAAIEGVCLGGGCELALACKFRVATNHPRTQLGLPETQLGIIPGWGGTQRLPRLIGVRAALELITSGRSLNAERALKCGLLDLVVQTGALRAAAEQVADGLYPLRRRKVRWENHWPMRTIICRGARQRVQQRTRGFYPAPALAIAAVEQGLGSLRREAGYENESRLFGQVAVTPECKNLIKVFYLRENYSKQRMFSPAEMAAPRLIEKVGVIGAGVMGAGIAHWCSSRGLTVRLKDVKPEFVAAGMKRISDMFRDSVRRRKISRQEAEQGIARVRPTTDYSGFAECDLIIEAVVERLDVKQQLFAEVAPLLKADCLIATNTSAIPLDQLAPVTGRPEQFVGLHFFNPVDKMPLVEVVRSQVTSMAAVSTAIEFVKQLKKIPIVVGSSPGFLVNRLLMPYLNEAGKLVGEGVPIAVVDKAMMDFGMPMGPLRLVDEVGIDVAVGVANELAAAFPDRMAVAPVLLKVAEAGLKGRKGGAGFYTYRTRPPRPNPAVAKMVDTTSPEITADTIQKRLLATMIAEAKAVLIEDVVKSTDDVDAAMIFGTGFPPFRGGLVKYGQDAGLWAVTTSGRVIGLKPILP